MPEYPELANKGKTPLYFAADGRFLGVIAAADVLKADSKAAVEAMEKLGLDVVMLTGDNGHTANAIANAAGISHVIADVLPGDKAGAVRALQQEGHRVLMVGDGINDAPALVTADVGMAIGAGTDIAMDSADIVLMQGSLGGVSAAVELSKATIRNIKQNLFWAFFYNALCIPVAAGVLYPIFGWQLSPMLGEQCPAFAILSCKNRNRSCGCGRNTHDSGGSKNGNRNLCQWYDVSPLQGNGGKGVQGRPRYGGCGCRPAGKECHRYR